MKTLWILDKLAIESVLYSLSHIQAPFAFSFLQSVPESPAFHVDAISSAFNFAFNANDYVEKLFFDYHALLRKALH